MRSDPKIRTPNILQCSPSSPRLQHVFVRAIEKARIAHPRPPTTRTTAVWSAMARGQQPGLTFIEEFRVQ